ncbi:glycosyltransferase family 20-domain-containing protein [Gongronella butleri]|nr:glycosyltransferase family 20-domain-containing protein [Gongronella butleri]
MANTEILTAEKVAHYLPFSGHSPTIQGRIINVTHQIPFNIHKSHDLRPDAMLISPPRSPPLEITKQRLKQETTVENMEAVKQELAIAEPVVTPLEKKDPVAAAPVSKLARHHQRGHTLRVKFHAADWTVVQRRGHAALYAGIQSLSKNYETIHIGWTGPIRVKGTKQAVRHIYQEDKVKLEKLLWDTDRIVPIFLDKKSHGHYEGYCKQVLWPLFHYIVGATATDGRNEKQYWADYVAVNQQFADMIIAHYREGDYICVHDYHLLLVPDMVRSKIPNAVIGLFFHATMPSSEILRCLTTRNTILRGMLGSTLIGFQTYSYARHFISSCTRVLGCESTQVGVNYNGHMVAVGAFPIGIDSDRVHMYCKQPGVEPKMSAIRDMYSDKKIVIGRDKLDSTKGVLQKLHAFEQLLERYPEWRNKVVLIQVATPTFGEHGKLESKISETVSHINSTYGSLEFTPVHYFHQDVDRDEYYALLSVADVGLITCIRDGMNTTSFEFIICQHERRSPLILSEFAGTAGSLSAAIHVNPWDFAGVARALNDALNMSDEDKLTRHEQLYKHVTSHTASYWAHSFLTQLISVSEQQSLQSHATPALNPLTLLHQYKLSNKRLMFFDYDGTLTPIVSTPSAAKPSPKLLTYLQALCDDPKNLVWVVSGRDQATLEDWLGSVRGLGFSAEHGCYVKPPNVDEWTSIVDDVDMSWKSDVTEIFTYYTERTQGSFIEFKKSSITWHYRMADAEYGEFQAKECQNHLENAIVSKLPVEILVGKKNLEVRPMSINKGEIVKRILSQNMDSDLVICAGDDKTDEDMFRMLNSINLASKFHRAKQKDAAIVPPSPASIDSGSTSSLASTITTSSTLQDVTNNSTSPHARTRRSPSVALSPIWSEMAMQLFSITVGPPEKKTLANWHVRSSEDVVECLRTMAETETTRDLSAN